MTAQLVMLILCQSVLCLPVLQAQTTFEIDTPAFIDTLGISPSSVALGDVNGDTLTDIVMYEPNIEPNILFYNPEISHYDSANAKRISFENGRNFTVSLVKTRPNESLSEELFFLNFNRGNSFSYRWVQQQDTSLFIETNEVQSLVAQSNVRHLSIGDFNNDGLPDVIIDRATGGFPVNRLITNFLSLGGQEAEALNSNITTPIENSLSSVLGDFNDDGFTDYYVMNDDGTQDRFFVGGNSGFEEKLTSQLKGASFSFGAAMGDFDNDGRMDIYRTNPREDQNTNNTMFQNMGSLEFESIDAGFSTLDRLNTRNAIFGDFDNDGDLDLLTAEFSTRNSRNQNVANSLYENLGGGNYAKRTQEPVMNKLGNWNSATFFDYNRDGQLDIVAFGSHNRDPIVFYKNRGNSNNWLSLKLEQQNSFHPEAYGAKLTLKATINGEQTTQIREYNRLQGFQIQHPGIIHFGLGDAVDAELTINWPSGNVSKHTFSGTEELNRQYYITEPLAGRLSAFKLNDDLTFEAALGDTVNNIFRFINSGRADVAINNVRSPVPYLNITDFSRQIAPEDTGFVAVQFTPFDNSQLGQNLDTLTIESNAINENFTIPIESQTFSLSAPFQRILSQDPLLARSDDYTASYWTDLDGDGLADPILLRRNESALVFKSTTDTTFQELPDALPDIQAIFNRATFGDINNDGLIDLFTATEGENRLFENTGDFTFDIIDAEEVSGVSESTVDASLADLNGDSFLDIILSNTSSQQNKILLQETPNRFRSVTGGDFTNDTRDVNSHLLVDFNNDGLTDIFVFSSEESAGESTVTLYRQNEQFEFNQTPVPGLTDLETDIRSGLAFDLDNDLDRDLLLLGQRQEAPLFLFRNDGNLQVTRLEPDLFKNIEGLFSDAAALDFNLDGYTDLFLTNSQFDQPNVLLESEGDERFLRFTTGNIVTETNLNSSGAATPDVDNNGHRDIFITNQLDSTRLYRDSLSALSTANWVGIIPRTRNNFGTEALVPGTRVTLHATIGGKEISQERIIGRNSSKSQALSGAYFGLGDASKATAEILFPDSTNISLTIDEVNRFYEPSTDAISVSNETEPQIPRSVQLEPNYPNPFNPTTTITFSLPASTDVQLEIYNVLGKRVATLVDRRMSTGTHTVNFQAQSLPSGVYLSVLKADGVRKVDKMTLIK